MCSVCLNIWYKWIGRPRSNKGFEQQEVILELRQTEHLMLEAADRNTETPTKKAIGYFPTLGSEFPDIHNV